MPVGVPHRVRAATCRSLLPARESVLQEGRIPSHCVELAAFAGPEPGHTQINEVGASPPCEDEAFDCASSSKAEQDRARIAERHQSDAELGTCRRLCAMRR